MVLNLLIYTKENLIFHSYFLQCSKTKGETTGHILIHNQCSEIVRNNRENNIFYLCIHWLAF